jgi:hypothetical protein
MKIEFHPSAKTNFDAKGEDLLLRVKPSVRVNKAVSSNFSPDLHVAAVLSENHLTGPIRREGIDTLAWKVKEIEFEGQEGLFALGELECVELDRLAEAIAKLSCFKERVSRKFIRSVIIDWIEERIRCQGTIALTEYLTIRARDEVQPVVVWFPISFLYVESGFNLGSVSFRPMTRQFFEAAQWGEHQKARHQGHAAVVLSFVAERLYAVETGLMEADTAVALLRVLHPANMYPGALLHCRPFGRENIENYEVLFVTEAGSPLGAKSDTLPPYPTPWELSDEIVEKLRPEGLDSLNEILSTSKRTRFQQELIDALLIYTKNNIAREPADKLLAILVSLETLLLRNDSEPIQQNLGDRMAFMLGVTTDERITISRMVKDVYAIRSQFIHHGEDLNDLELLQKFMQYSWILFLRLLRSHSQFNDRQTLLDALDRRKYS